MEVRGKNTELYGDEWQKAKSKEGTLVRLGFLKI
jgi:hypothetical protein